MFRSTTLAGVICLGVIFPAIAPPAFAQTTTYKFDRMWPTLQQPWYFWGPADMASEANGNIYVSDIWGETMWRFSQSGAYLSSFHLDNIDRTWVFDTDADGDGNVYMLVVSDVRKYSSRGQLLNVFNNVTDGSIAASMTVDEVGNIYIASNSRIKKLDPRGVVIQDWGGPGSNAGQFAGMETIGRLALDPEGDLWVLDTGNGRVQHFDSGGGFISQWPILGINIQDGSIGFDRSGILYLFSIASQLVLKYDRTGELLGQWGVDGEFMSVFPSGSVAISNRYLSSVKTYSPGGSPNSVWTPRGSEPNRFYEPQGVAVDSHGNVYVADQRNHRIQKFGSDGHILKVWGSWGTSNGLFNFPHYLAVDPTDTFVYVSDHSDRIQKFTTDGAFVLAWGGSGTGNGQFSVPLGVAVDKNGYVYVAENSGQRIQKFGPNGQFIAKYGEGILGFAWGIDVDTHGRMYVTSGNQIIKLDSSGSVLTAWGGFDGLQGVALDTSDNVYTVEYGTNRVQKFSSEGSFLQTWGSFGKTTGQFLHPYGIAVGLDGTVVVCDTYNERVQSFRPVTLSTVSKAIVIAAGGPFPGNNLWDATQVCANFGYRTLTYQGYTKDTIQYLSSDTDLDLDQNGVADDVDGDCTLANLQTALTTWASTPVNGLPVDSVVVYLVDHGGVGQFRMNATETLSAAQLQTWLNTVQAAIPGKLIVVYDACESGSFMSALAAPQGYAGKRLVLTSTSPGESAYFVTRGTVSFSNYFWTQIFNGVSVKDAFDIANQALSQTFGYQHPLLDDTGDGAGNTAEDGALASGTFIGNGTRQYWEGPVITAVSGNQNITGTSTASLWADPVTDTDGVARVWGVIRPPDFDQASSDNPVTGLPQVELFPTTGDRFEGTYQYFTTPGTYNILVYAMDRVGNVSAPKLTTVSVGTPLKRKAIIAAGGSSSDVNWPGYEGAIRGAYDALLYQGYVDADITFMSPVGIAGVDYASSLSNLQNALTPAFNANTQDVTVCLVGPGDGAGFSIAPGETLTATQLDGWLDTLQGAIPGTVTLVYDGSNSGSFLASLTPPSGKRIVLSSATATQSASFLRNGSISFSKFFWGRVLNGATVYEGYSYARAAMKFAGYGQLAMLDDNADGVGSTVNDGVLSRKYYIGTGVLLAGDDPIIGTIVSPQDISGTSSATLWVDDVTTTSVLDRVYAVIAKPDGNVVSVELTDTGGGHYATTYANFDLYGDYGIAVYATDTQGGVSAPVETTVSRLDGPDQYEVDDTAAEATWVGAATSNTQYQRHTFHTASDDDWVFFDAAAGDDVTIEAYNVGANAQCMAELFASDGTTLLDQDFTGLEPGGAIIEYIVPANGSFYVRLTNLLGMAGAGTNYDLRIYKSTGPCGSNGGDVHVNVRSTSSGLPLSGVTVNLSGYGLPKSRTTTSTGTVEFLGLEAATYTASVSEPGYTTTIIPNPVVVTCGTSYNVTANLTPTSPPPVLQVTPTQEQSNAPANSKTFTVTNAGGGTLNWTATILPGSEWLSFNGGNTGTNAGSFTVQYGKNDAATARTGWVRLTAPGADGSGVEVSVKQKADTDAPTITLASAAGSTVTGAITVTATLSENSSNFAAGDVTATNAAVSGFTGSGASYSFTLTPTYAGSCSVQVNAGVFTDAASNGNTASNVLTKTYTPSQVWVDMAYAGIEHGTQAQPYNTLAEGVSAVATAGTLKVKGNTAEHPRITKAMRITANTAPTRIGGTTGLLARVLDTDGDGLPDVWELQHGLNPKDASGDNGAFGDPDNDGLTNAREMAENSDPLRNGAKDLPAMTSLGAFALLAGVCCAAVALLSLAARMRSRSSSR